MLKFVISLVSNLKKTGKTVFPDNNNPKYFDTLEEAEKYAKENINNNIIYIIEQEYIYK